MIQVFYHVTDAAKAEGLARICRTLKMECAKIGPQELDRTLAELVGAKLPLAGKQIKKAPIFYAMPELIVFSGMSSEQLDEFLSSYKNEGLPPVKLKAVITPTNLRWTLYELAEHLKEEAR